MFSHAQSLLIKHKKIFECFSCFWKVFCFCKNVKNVKKLFCPVLATQLRVDPVTCPSRKKYLEYFSKFEFLMFLVAQSGDLFAGGGSSREGTQRFSRLISRLFHG